MKAYTTFGTRKVASKTPQTQKLPDSDQVKNSAGGYSFAVGDWKRLDRFLILGSEGGSYYCKEKKLTKQNAKAVLRCIKEDGKHAANMAVSVSIEGRAVKNDPALFVLAACAAAENNDVRKYALSMLPVVARTSTHLFSFIIYVTQFRGWGRALRRAIGNWYNNRTVSQLVYQVVKYKSRYGMDHSKAIRLSHLVPKTKRHQDVYNWIINDVEPDVDDLLPDYSLDLLHASLEAMRSTDEHDVIMLIEKYGLTREMIPNKFLGSRHVWEALLENMPMHAMVRNLGKMSSVGLLTQMSDAERAITEDLSDAMLIKRSRLHPLSILVAMNTYNLGHGVRGSLKWDVNPNIVDALNDAFYLSFGNVEPTGKRIMLSLDVSASMTGGEVAGMTGISPRVGSAAMALVTKSVEKNAMINGFTTGLTPLNISSRQRLTDVIKTISRCPFGGTDCALPMLYATKKKLKVDAFVIYTDSETYAGVPHPSEALKLYRDKSGIPAKLIVVGMLANEFTLADPTDAGMLDVVGFSTSAPQAISEFIRG